MFFFLLWLYYFKLINPTYCCVLQELEKVLWIDIRVKLNINQQV